MRFNLRAWFAAQTPRGQLYSGCLVILVLSSCLLYGLGAFSYTVRPLLFSGPVAVTTLVPVVRPTMPPTPTQAPLATMALPGSTLVATPTQAPVPTRAPTSTPTAEGPFSITPEGTPSVTPANTNTAPPSDTPPPPTIAATKTPQPPTNTPGPTRTRKPTKTPTKPSALTITP